jgi:aminoglycoside phosphotransferase (APT) family kinase protein
MERVDGLVPPTVPHFSREGWVVDATPAQRERLWHTGVEQLVALHRLDADRFDFLARPDRGDNGLEQDLAYWEAAQRWAGAAHGYPILDAGAAWLHDHLPADPPTRLSWGDARVENMLFRDFRCVAVLDFETASLAGPLGDLAWWVLMDRARGALPGFGSPRETVARYRDLGGPEPTDFRYWGVLTAYRLAVIHVKLARQMAARGIETATTHDFGATSEKMQQLALLLEWPPPGDRSASLPDVDW